jgi:hypothetical protein
VGLAERGIDGCTVTDVREEEGHGPRAGIGGLPHDQFTAFSLHSSE